MFYLDTTIYDNIEKILTNDVTYKKKNKIEYLNIPCVLDIETSSFYENGEKRGVMYAFVFGINGKCVILRTYEEMLHCFERVVSYYGLNHNTRKMIIYIHNLSYEFQFIVKHLNIDKVFALDKREPVYFTTFDGLEFRCSYLLSGYSLETVGKNLITYKVQKMKGDLDYSKIRHSKTPLTKKEYGYILNDGLVVMAYIQEQIEHYKSITKIPLTKTGVVRNYCRNNCLFEKSSHNKTRTRKYSKYHSLMLNLPISSLTEYTHLKLAFHGGFTHANPVYANRTLENVSSYDFTSSYPYVMVSEQYPMTKGELYQIKDKEDFYRQLKLYCCLFKVTFYNLEDIFYFEHPISQNKCIICEDAQIDNGRVVNASKLSLYCTETDFKIYQKFYKWKQIQISNFRRYKKAYLPRDFVLSILNLYVSKTTLKGVKGSEKEYMHSKENLNSCYGMCVTDICRDNIEYNNDELWFTTEQDYKELLDKYNKSHRRFLCYQWGIWVTAYAQYNLFTAIYRIKYDYIYADTDSIKIRHLERYKDYFDQYNQIVEKKLEIALKHQNIDISMASPKTKDGVTKFLGFWDYEGTYKKFKTLGAKRYMVECVEPIKYKTENGDIYLPYSLTVSGLNKNYAIPYLYKKYGDKIFDVFEDGLSIPSEYTGKLTHTYIDEEIDGDVVDYLGNSGHYHELSFIHLEPTSFNLSMTDAYIKFILSVKYKYEL